MTSFWIGRTVLLAFSQPAGQVPLPQLPFGKDSFLCSFLIPKAMDF